MMAARAQVSLVITERRNSMIAGTCARSAAGVPNLPISGTSKRALSALPQLRMRCSRSARLVSVYTVMGGT